MKKTLLRSITTFSAAFLLFGTAAAAQTKTVSKQGPNGGVYEATKTRQDGTVTTTKSATSPGGKSASSARVRDVDGSDGQRGQTVTQTGPNGKSRTASQTWTQNGDGTATRERSATGSHGDARSSALQVGNGQASKTVQSRAGGSRTTTRTRKN